jgi:hypothetical protein
MLFYQPQAQQVHQHLQLLAVLEFIVGQVQVVLPSKEKTTWRILHN